MPTLVHDGKVIREVAGDPGISRGCIPDAAAATLGPACCARMRLWTKLIDEFLHVDSRTIGQCVAMRSPMRDVDPADAQDALRGHAGRDPPRQRSASTTEGPQLAAPARRASAASSRCSATSIVRSPTRHGSPARASRSPTSHTSSTPAVCAFQLGACSTVSATAELAGAHPRAAELCGSRGEMGRHQRSCPRAARRRGVPKDQDAVGRGLRAWSRRSLRRLLEIGVDRRGARPTGGDRLVLESGIRPQLGRLARGQVDHPAGCRPLPAGT